MSEVILYTLTFCGLIICFMDWRKGVLMVLIMGFLQEILRKVLPGQPVYMSAYAIFFAIVVLLGAFFSGVSTDLRRIPAWRNYLRNPGVVFAFLVLAQCFHSFIKSGNLMLSGIGFLAYLSPIPLIFLIYHYTRGMKDVYLYITVYVTACIVMTTGTYLTYAGYDWKILEGVGSGLGRGLYIYPVSGGKLELLSGFFRSPEIAAWHAGAASIFIVILLVTYERRPTVQFMLVCTIVFLAGAVILSGRRKVLAEVVLYVSVYGGLLLYFRRGAGRLAFYALITGFIIFTAGQRFLSQPADQTIMRYIDRADRFDQTLGERLHKSTIGAFHYVVRRNGFFGSGAGMGSQGAQYFGGGPGRVGGSAEGGLAKILAELGIPGLAVFFWLLVKFGQYMWRLMKSTETMSPAYARLACGLAAFLFTELIVYTVAHQAFGDVFVLLNIGWATGFLFAMPKILDTARTQSRAQA